MVGHVLLHSGGFRPRRTYAMTDIRRDEATRMQTVRRLQEARRFLTAPPTGPDRCWKHEH